MVLNKSIAVVKWTKTDGIAFVIFEQLRSLGYQPVYFDHDSSIPDDVDFIFSFGPYGRLFPILNRLSAIHKSKRPIFFHWNYESLPNPNLLWLLLKHISSFRSWFDRLFKPDHILLYNLVADRFLKHINSRMIRYRYLGEYQYFYREGLIDFLVDISRIFANFHSSHGLDCRYIPWGTPIQWYDCLSLKRDIDVLWMGKRRTRRRSMLLDKIKTELEKNGVNFYIADNVENPFIYGDERTQLLNRSKITLNLLPTWYDPAFIFRFHMAAGNRSMIVSEPILPHCPSYKSGEYYVEAPVNKLVDTIQYYLNNINECSRITENAFQLATTRLTLRKSVQSVMIEAEKYLNKFITSS